MDVLQNIANAVKSVSATLEVNALAVLGVIAIGIAVRAVEKEQWLGRGGYVLLTLALGIIAGLIVPPPLAGWKARLLSGLGHGGVASITYQVVLTILPGTKYRLGRPK
jgi:hypothetical protein